MLRTEYKFWYVMRDDAGWITEAAVRFHEGDYAQVLVESEPGGPKDKLVTVFRRDKRLGMADLTHLKSKKKKADSPTLPIAMRKDAVIYGQSDFGTIKTDEELLAFMDSEVAKDPTRKPVREQGGPQ